ncbi:sugar phosphate isomerase/epimerase [Aeromicrobium phragmitis]|uniref:Sugar phosphate isomerase/epimerase n=1 Tax=Aeromicrobium phragmitis TaxID=2478914 RepID=A0A3L8PNP7_9ACTN|nr:sugar phosphate isomerase/epimerase [Aeromicrobium phragmitis]RLV56313.1 sugar phosphate isomerase/epimerase [Aeromicrobium phragmitis]
MKDTPPITVSLSTSSVYPDSTAAGFDAAARLGYDAVEVMVGIDEISTDINAVRVLSETHGIRVGSVHAPCLLLTQRIWGLEPWGKLHRSAEMALELGAEVVVVHPPFRWQRDYARGFVEGIAALEEQYEGLDFAVENMYPWRSGKREFQAYAPDWDPTPYDYAHVTLDLSHTATAHADPVAMARDLGPRLRHIHLADGTGSGKDEHLVPGRGTQPCAEFLEELAEAGFDGQVVVEISTRKAADGDARENDLLEALAYARLHAVALPS